MSKYCPKCYGKIQKESGRCLKCGFSLNDLKNASNKEAIEQIRLKNSDLVLKTNILPKDVSKKKLLLFCGFLGLFGAHNFYVGNMFKGFFNLVSTIFGIIFITFSFFKIESATFQTFNYIFSLLMAVNFVCVLSDFFNIIFNRFKVYSYLKED